METLEQQKLLTYPGMLCHVQYPACVKQCVNQGPIYSRGDGYLCRFYCFGKVIRSWVRLAITTVTLVAMAWAMIILFLGANQ